MKNVPITDKNLKEIGAKWCVEITEGEKPDVMQVIKFALTVYSGGYASLTAGIDQPGKKPPFYIVQLPGSDEQQALCREDLEKALEELKR